MSIRHYGIPDADMFEQSRTVRAIFNLDKALFISRVPTLADPFTDEWLASILASEAYQSAEVRTDIQEEETADVLALMAQAREKYNEAKLYIKLAFANEPVQFKRFGLDDYEEAAQSQKNMVVFLTNLHTQCNAAAPALLAQGWTLPAIDAIATLATNLSTENTGQNVMIATTTEATEARIVQYNSTFAYWQRVNEVSKVVFYGNPIKLNQYNLPEGPQPNPDINLKGKITDTANGLALKNVSVLIKELNLTVLTNYAGNYSFVSVPPGTYTLSIELAGYGTVEIPFTMLASGVVVKNASLTVL